MANVATKKPARGGRHKHIQVITSYRDAKGIVIDISVSMVYAYSNPPNQENALRNQLGK